MKKTFSDRLKHAFSFEKTEAFEPDEKDRELMEIVCKAVVERGMATPATLFLESTRPLNYLGSQTMVFFEPVMRAVLRKPEAWDRFARILEHRGSIEYLCRRIEALDGERRTESRPSGQNKESEASLGSDDTRTSDETNPDEQ